MTPATIRIAWLGELPEWLISPPRLLADVEITSFDARSAPPHVIHVDRHAIARLRSVKDKAPGARLALDLSTEPAGALTWRATSQAADADLVLAGSLFQLRELRRRAPRLSSRSALFRQPIVDLDSWGPEAPSLQEDGRDLRRFRRFHRMASPTILYAGPYTPEGGLDLAIAAAWEVRKQFPETRLAAIPLGEISERYLNRCERAALRLGHRGVIEWTTPAKEALPMWFHVADVVCLPARDIVSTRPALLAGAAGRPVVGSGAPQLLEHAVDNATGLIVRSGEPAELSAAITSLLADPVGARRLGEASRRRVVQEHSPEVAAATLLQHWLAALSERRPASIPAPVAPGTWPGLAEKNPGTIG